MWCVCFYMQINSLRHTCNKRFIASATSQPVAWCRQVFGALSIYATTAKQPSSAPSHNGSSICSTRRMLGPSLAATWQLCGNYWPQRIGVLLIMCIINIFIAFWLCCVLSFSCLCCCCCCCFFHYSGVWFRTLLLLFISLFHFVVHLFTDCIFYCLTTVCCMFLRQHGCLRVCIGVWLLADKGLHTIY